MGPLPLFSTELENPEIILNLWYVYDDLGYIYSLRGRTYIGYGTDQEKLDLLQHFAENDYLIAKPFPVPTRYHTHGQAIAPVQLLAFDDMVYEFFREVIKGLDNDIPTQTPYSISEKPLICLTPLFGTTSGRITPKIDGVRWIG